MSKPIAVIAGDIHYSLKNLELADKSTRMAIAKANQLQVPFIANGDTQDQKANLRAECVNTMIETFKTAKCTPYVNIGNHCKINSKGIEHALNFLRPYANVVEVPEYIKEFGYWIVPYHDDPEELRQFLRNKPPNKFIMHQGLEHANKGDYIQDKSAINHKDVAGHLVIASHYHERQTIGLESGRWEYIGSPYTQSFGEAHDPRKGFQILYNDGNLEFIPTNLRKHVILTMKDGKYLDSSSPGFDARDLVWVKAQSRMTREEIRDILGIDNFKLTYELPEQKSKVREVNLTQSEILDNIINDMSNTGEEQKKRLQNLWKSL